MGKKASFARSARDREELDEELALRRWAQSSRYVTIMSLRDQARAIEVEGADQSKRQSRSWAKAGASAFLTVALTVLLIAVAAFLAGLL